MVSAAAFLAFLAGVAAITLLLSRLALLATKWWDGKTPKLVAVHVTSLAICCVIYTLQHPSAWLDCFLYAVVQGVWFLVDWRIGWGYSTKPDRNPIDEVFR